MAQSQQAAQRLEAAQRESAREEEDNADSDIEVTDPEDVDDKMMESQANRGRADERDERSVGHKDTREVECEVQDLSIKKRKIDFTREDSPDLSANTHTSGNTMASIQNNFMEMICRNAAQAECT